VLALLAAAIAADSGAMAWSHARTSPSCARSSMRRP
jgi:hypothetical protein